jgi:hypothetical protein
LYPGKLGLVTWLRVVCISLYFLSTATGTAAQNNPPADAAAQVTTAAFTGAVTDRSGAPIAGAKVVALDSNGKAHEAITDDQGLYAVMDVPAGKYTITVTAQGAEIYRADAQVNAGEVQTLNITPQLPPEPAAPPAGPSIFFGQAQPAMPTPPPGAVKGAATISGSVSDQTGAAVVGAKIELINASGAVVQSAASDDKGNYTLRGVAPGSYKLTVSAPLFKTFETSGLSVRGTESVPIDAALEPAGEKTEVNVEGTKVSQVETETSQVSGTITEKEVLTLGLNGRNFTQLIALTPGVSNQTGQDEAHVGVTGSVKYSVNGGRVEYNTFEVDGGDVLNAGLNGAESTLMVYPSLDAIQEVKVLTSNYGAMYGRTASGTVLVTTKSGTPQWHGSAYEFFRNEIFNARNYFDQTTKAPLYRRNDFGFTIGGPLFIPGVYNLRKDKTFVFWSEEFRYEKSPTDQQPNFNHAVPSLAERMGDFNDVCPQNTDSFSRSLWPDCPSAGPSSNAGLLQTFPQNIVTAVPDTNGTLDPNALAWLSTNLIPLPNSATGCNSTIGSCYNAVISEPTYWREELFRLDHNLTSKLRLSLRYIHDAWNTTVPVPQWGFLKNSFPTVQNKFVGPGISVVARLTDTITPSLLNDFTVTYANSHITLENVNGPGGADFHRPDQLSQPGGTCQDLVSSNGFLILPSCPMGTLFNNGFGGKAPGILFGGTNQAYGGSGFAVDTAYMPWSHTNPTYSVRDDVSIVIGKHTLQFGAQYILSQRNELNGAIGAASGDVQGLLTFSNINGGAANTGNSFANFLTLRNIQSGSSSGTNAIQSFTQDSAQQRYHNSFRIIEPYVQDDWRVNSRLTVNLGVRFSLFGLFEEKDKRAYNWDPNAYDPALAAQVLVDPNTGQLLSATQGGPIPLNPNSPDPRLLNGIVQCGVNGVPRGCMKGHLFNPAPRVGFALDPKGDGKTSIRAGYGIFFEHGTPEEANTGSLEGSAPLVLSVTQRFPTNYGCIGGSQTTCVLGPGAFPINVTSIPTQAIWPYAQQWSLSVQRELPASMVATVAYVGSKGTHLTVERQLNQLRPLPEGANPFGIHEPLIQHNPTGPGGDCGGFRPLEPDNPVPFFPLLNGTVVEPQNPAYISLIAACAGANGGNNPTPDVNTLRPYPGFGQIFSLQNVADSTYHAMQATVRRTRGPLTIGVSYSYSHSFDDASDRSDTTLVDSYDLRSNRASSNFDQRHLLTVSYIYTLPGKKLIDWWQNTINSETPADGTPSPPAPPASRLTRAILDGWQISGITSFQSGTPFSVINGGSTSISALDNAGVANGIGAGSYPDLATDPSGEPFGGNNPRSFGPLLGNPNRFVAPRGLTFGNAGRNFLNNPGRLNFDVSLLKHFSVTESGVLEFRAEAFNIFNHTQFRLYNPDLGNTGSNVISCYGGSDYSAGYQVPGGVDCLTGSSFLHPVDAHRPRTIQLGLKYTF